MATPISQRVKKHREGLREAGLRPVQIWVPDTRARHFMNECRRQCLRVAEADVAEDDLLPVLDAALNELEGWSA